MQYEIEIRHRTHDFTEPATVRVILPDGFTHEMFALASEGARALGHRIFELGGLPHPNVTNETSGPYHADEDSVSFAKGLGTEVANGFAHGR